MVCIPLSYKILSLMIFNFPLVFNISLFLLEFMKNSDILKMKGN